MEDALTEVPQVFYCTWTAKGATVLDRNWRRGATVLAVLFVLAHAAICLAESPQKMNYQAMLTDNNDQPLINQPVQLDFGIWTAANGGNCLWNESHSTATNWIGVVSIVLGSENPIDVEFSTPCWLQVEVDNEVLSPRREMVGASYALYDERGGTGDGHSLDASDGSPLDALYVDSTGNVGVGTTSPLVDFHVDGQMQVGSAVSSGKLTVQSSVGSACVFDGAATGDNSVSLPMGSISTYEITGEAGVASATNGGGADLLGGVQSLAVRSLSAPCDGYMLAMGTVQIALEHPGGGVASTVRVGVTDEYPSWPANQDSYIKVPGDAAAGDYHHTVTVHGLIPMTSGQAKTINLYVSRISGSNGYYRNVQLTLAFFPSAYGTIEPMGAPARSDDDEIFSEIERADLTPHSIPDATTTTSDDETTRLLHELMARVEELESR